MKFIENKNAQSSADTTLHCHVMHFNFSIGLLVHFALKTFCVSFLFLKNVDSISLPLTSIIYVMLFRNKFPHF